MKSLLYISTYKIKDIQGFVNDLSFYLPQHKVVEVTPFSVKNGAGGEKH